MNKTETMKEVSKILDQYKPINRAESGEMKRLREQCGKYRGQKNNASRRVKEMTMLCEKMLTFIVDTDLDSDPVAHLLRSCIISDAESMGIAPANKGE